RNTVIMKNVPGLGVTPPLIFVSRGPAILLNIDGAARWRPVVANDLDYAVNTDSDLFREVSTETYYLRDDKRWLQASSVRGPWTAATNLPPGFNRLPQAGRWRSARAALPTHSPTAASVPTVFVSLQPAELIVLDGDATYQHVPGTARLL